jgi:hypothetical protein
MRFERGVYNLMVLYRVRYYFATERIIGGFKRKIPLYGREKIIERMYIY